MSTDAAANTAIKTFTCHDCGESKPIPESGGTGYGVIDGHQVCYSCCAIRDVAFMKEHGRIALYLTQHKCDDPVSCNHTIAQRDVTNWPGTLRFLPFNYIRRTIYAGFCGRLEREDVWFMGPDGAIWHGVCQGDMELLHCRRTKSRL